MSQESSKVLNRQWKIIQFLLDSRYVSTADIEKYLNQQGLPTTQRTIQRDLNLLENIFPLECRRDCMPYSWRWKRIETTIKGLNLTQALILRLVDEELQDVLPKQMLQELAPLFQKAKLFSSNAVMQHKTETNLLDILKSSNHRGILQPSILGQITQGISDKVTEIYRDTFNIEQKESHRMLTKLAIILEQYDMKELALSLKL